MFKATLADTNLLKESMSSIAEIIDEGIFKIRKDGLSFTAADRAMVAVVDFHIASAAFEKYELDSDQKMGLNMANFLSVLRRVGGSDKLTLELRDAKLQVTIEGTSKRRFLVPLLDLGEEEIPPVDQLEFKSKVQIKTEALQNGLSDAEIIGDSIIFDSSPNRFGMVSEGDVSKFDLELVKGDPALVELTTTVSSRARYALDYLKKMAKAAKMSDIVTLEHGQDYPLRMGFAAGEKAMLRFILAPRVQES
jgi:proliferating cell nuclear antigen PCNA